MRKVINTFKYGSMAVKLTLLATIICGLATVGFLISAIILGQLIWFFAMIFAGFITVSLAQTFAINGGISDEEEKVKTKKDFEANEGGSEEGNINFSDDSKDIYSGFKIEYDDMEEDDMDDDEYDDEISDEEDVEHTGKKKKKKTKKNKIKKDRKTKKKSGKNLSDSDESDDLDESDEKLDRMKRKKTGKTSKEKKKKTSNKKALVSKKATKKKIKKVAKHGSIPKVASVSKVDIDYKAMLKKDIKESKKALAKKDEISEADSDAQNPSDTDNDSESNGNRTKAVVPEPLTAETVKQYNLKKIKKTLHKYKVKRDHKLAIIDRCETFNISQTPAYIWVDGNEFHMLLIEQEPRHLVLSTFKVGRIKYLKKQPVDIKTDYDAFNTKSLVTDLFRPYLPDYNQSNVDSDLNYYKNLYGIGPGIYFTNNSAKQLINFFGFGMDVDDKVTESKRVNLYFKDAYKANIMVRDNVLDANGYADRISSILEEMAASNLSYNEFKETLNLMIKNKFITKEFGMYYMDVRDKKHS